MQLVLVSHRCRAALHVTQLRSLVSHDECPLELPRAFRVDPEVAGKLHRAFDSFGNIAETAVAEDRRVERGEEIVPDRYHRGEIFPDQIRMLLDGFRETAEYDSLFRQRSPEGCRHRDGIEDRVDCHDSGQRLAFPHRDAQFLECLLQFRVDLFRALRVLLRGSVVDNVLKINFRHIQMSPLGHLHPLPLSESVQPELQHPFRLFLETRDGAYDVLVQSLGYEVLPDLRDEALLVLLPGDLLNYLIFFLNVHSNK